METFINRPIYVETTADGLAYFNLSDVETNSTCMKMFEGEDGKFTLNRESEMNFIKFIDERDVEQQRSPSISEFAYSNPGLYTGKIVGNFSFSVPRSDGQLKFKDDTVKLIFKVKHLRIENILEAEPSDISIEFDE